MKIFITGGTGFIGSYVLRSALAAGHEVLCLRRTSFSHPCLTLSQEPIWLNKSLAAITPSDLNNIDAIIHLAATGVSPRRASWEELEAINVRGTLSMCSLARAIEARLIIAGSFAEYGLSGLNYDFIPTSAPLEPTFPYAASKAAASVLAKAFALDAGIELAYLRIFNAYGEGQDPSNLWPSLKKAAIDGSDFPMTPGEQIRDFIEVEQVARYFLKVLDLPSASFHDPVILNIGSGVPQSIKDVCSSWWQQWNAKGRLLVGDLPYRKAEVMRFVPETSDQIFE
jgi:nucleoside-diphosphate-sugar epimerase